MKRALEIARRLNIEGRHLHNCFAAESLQKEGWRKMQMARRICRRLGWKPEAVL
jgi:tRNA(Glu) U13 pseudouridine synthase TruD